ncbi:MAG: class I SAM-dependent methyltransferase, partial [Bacteroidetes bacterium]|nr:class I SAM-dependent methyltransferase [Bacteroidota bacterium]
MNNFTPVISGVKPSILFSQSKVKGRKYLLKKALKNLFPGVSWQNPVLNFTFKVMDPIDYLFRFRSGLTGLPPYSIRVRSNGVTKQFGGEKFYQFGNRLADHLKAYASLDGHSKVLEIGCGCGRTCYALSKILDDANFIGMDIEKTSLEACQNNPIFIGKDFRFDYQDIQNDEYNPDGTYEADSYKFPYDSNEFDVIFLVSVFTHMLTDDVKNYISEISRMLKPGGVCMITTFLMDHGRNTNGISFPHNEKDH